MNKKRKKFNAAEKHFEKKRLQLNRIISNLEAQLRDVCQNNQNLRNRCDELETENRNLKELNQKLLETSNMSLEEIETLIRHEKEMCGAWKSFNAMLHSSHFGI